MSFAETLKKIRLKNKDSLHKMEAKTGIVFTYIHKIENDLRPIDKENLKRILKAYPLYSEELEKAYLEEVSADILKKDSTDLSKINKIDQIKEKDFELSDEKAREIGIFLKNRREEVGYSTNQFSIITKIDKGDLSRIENGKKKRLNPIYLKEIAKALELDVIELFKKVGFLDEKSLKYSEDKFKLNNCNKNTITLPVYGKINADSININLGREIYFFPIIKGNFSKKSFLVEISFNTMFPTLKYGDFVLVEPNDTRYEKNKIYLLAYNDETFIKRIVLNKKTGIIILRSDNEKYDDILINKEEQKYLKIIGRVIQKISNEYL